jgi:hypothetical protein
MKQQENIGDNYITRSSIICTLHLMLKCEPIGGTCDAQDTRTALNILFEEIYEKKILRKSDCGLGDDINVVCI